MLTQIKNEHLKSQIIIASNPPIAFTLQDISVAVGVTASLIGICAIAVNIITKINKISFTVNAIEDTLKLHATNAERIKDLDKRLDIHLQDYINYKDGNLLSHNGLQERIDHKWERTENEFIAIKAGIKELQGFLQSKGDFKVRE